MNIEGFGYWTDTIIQEFLLSLPSPLGLKINPRAFALTYIPRSLFCWLVGWLVSWLVGWLVGWLIGDGGVSTLARLGLGFSVLLPQPPSVLEVQVCTTKLSSQGNS